jgi:hypothetical protein
MQRLQARLPEQEGNSGNVSTYVVRFYVSKVVNIWTASSGL